MDMNPKARGLNGLMKYSHHFWRVLFLFALSSPAWSNPLPMPDVEETIDVFIFMKDGKAYAHFTAFHETGTPIAENVTEILYPIVDTATSITLQGDTGKLDEEFNHIWQDMNWIWSDRTYPTILPEIPSIPMMAWLPPFPYVAYNGEFSWAEFRIDFEFELIKRGDEFIFFYPLGVWKLLPNDPQESRLINIAFVEIPAGYKMKGAWLDDEECPYTVPRPGSYNFCFTTSEIYPDRYLKINSLRKDLIVSFVPKKNAANAWALYP